MYLCPLVMLSHSIDCNDTCMYPHSHSVMLPTYIVENVFLERVTNKLPLFFFFNKSILMQQKKILMLNICASFSHKEQWTFTSSLSEDQDQNHSEKYICIWQLKLEYIKQLIEIITKLISHQFDLNWSETNFYTLTNWHLLT